MIVARKSRITPTYKAVSHTVFLEGHSVTQRPQSNKKRSKSSTKSRNKSVHRADALFLKRRSNNKGIKGTGNKIRVTESARQSKKSIHGQIVACVWYAARNSGVLLNK